MQVFQQWAESFKIFLPSNFKLFLLVTLNAVWQGTKAWFARWWWLAVLYIVINTASLSLYAWGMSHAHDSVVSIAFLQKLDFFNKFLGYASFGLWVLIFWTLFLSIRPSVLKKTYSYYVSYSFHGILVLALYVALFFLVHYLDAFYATANYYKIIGGSLLSPLADTIMMVALGYILIPFIPFGTYLGAGNSLIFAPFLILFVFSFLDSPCSISGFLRSLIRAFKLVVYVYPFLWIVTCIMTVLASVKTYVELQVVTQLLSKANMFPLARLALVDGISLLIGLFLVIVLYSIVSNVYTKQVHEHFERYY